MEYHREAISIERRNAAIQKIYIYIYRKEYIAGQSLSASQFDLD